MGFIKFLSSRLFLKHLLLAVALIGLLSYGVLKALDVYTRHGEAVSMPDLRGLDPEEFAGQVEVFDFKFIVIDSVFEPSMPGGTVFSQDPLPGSLVKKHRQVYLTLVTRATEKVPLPDLNDFTLRQAKAMLETYGLTIDSLEFVPDLGKTVLRMKIGGEIVEPGEEVDKGTAVVLVLGMGQSNERINIPLLIGKTPLEVHNLLSDASLNTGAEFFPGGEDQEVVVIRQRPAPRPGARIPMGTPIDVWYTPLDAFDYNQALRQLGIDSLTYNELLNDTLAP